MHFCLENLEKIIKDDKSRTSRRDKNDTALVITDRLFGGKIIIAEWVPPYSIQLAIRITPSLQDVSDSSLVDIFEFLLGLTATEAVQLIYEPDTKKCAVAIKFPCEQLTRMAGSLGDGADELFSFVDKYMDEIRKRLHKHKIMME